MAKANRSKKKAETQEHPKSDGNKSQQSYRSSKKISDGTKLGKKGPSRDGGPSKN